MRKLLSLLFILFVFCIQANVLFATNNFCTANPENIQSGDLTNSSNSSTSDVSLGQTAKLVPPTIILSGIGFESRIAQLSWTTSDPSAVGVYTIERDSWASGVWLVVAQLPYNVPLQYDDTITWPFCDSLADLTYRVSFEVTATGEIGTSNIIPLALQDMTQPVNAENVIVSISNGNNKYPLISWDQVKGDDISGYEINHWTGFWTYLTTKPPDSTSSIDKTVNDVCLKSYSYAVITLDGCGLRSVPDYAMRSTITLNLSVIQPCDRLANLTWNPYIAMPGGLGGYRIYRKVDNGTPTEIANLTDTTKTSYTDAFQFEDGRIYSYYIMAYSVTGSGSSHSCEVGIKYSGSAVPDSVYITQVSVEADKNIKISFNSEPLGTVKKLILERSIDGGIFQPVDSIYNQYAFVEKLGSFTDTTVNVHSQSYSYRLIAVDVCGTTSIYSNISKSIFLQCDTTSTQNIINWNAYESWLKDVEGYKIFRTVAGQPAGGELLQSVSSSTLTYPDLATDVDPTKQACYWVVAAENPGNPYLTNAFSYSNTCCIIKGATLFMPNAFRPGGINDRFKPVATFVDPQSFKMTIFNRWGQQLFETTDMVNGWNGEINGQFANEGLYAFIVTYKSVGGEDYTKRGTVMVVR